MSTYVALVRKYIYVYIYIYIYTYLNIINKLKQALYHSHLHSSTFLCCFFPHRSVVEHKCACTRKAAQFSLIHCILGSLVLRCQRAAKIRLSCHHRFQIHWLCYGLMPFCWNVHFWLNFAFRLPSRRLFTPHMRKSAKRSRKPRAGLVFLWAQQRVFVTQGLWSYTMEVITLRSLQDYPPVN